MQIPINWLLEGPPYVQYRTRVDLSGQAEEDSAVCFSRAAMLAQPDIRELVASLQDWPGKVLASHRSASQSFHTLNFLADLGLRCDDPGINEVIQKILATASPEGPFRLSMNISSSHGGSGQDTSGWVLCDAPNQVYALLQFGLQDNPRVQKALAHLIALVEDFGWPCAASPELGNFHGPGRKNDPCPYANLAMLKVLSRLPDGQNHPAANTGIQTILNLWKLRLTYHPFIFYMGTDFCKLKAPLIWYDILHVLDVLSCFPQAIRSSEYREMLEIIKTKAAPDGTFIPESVYMPYKNWDFGQKKLSSRWLTFLVHRILIRSERTG